MYSYKAFFPPLSLVNALCLSDIVIEAPLLSIESQGLPIPSSCAIPVCDV